MKKCKLLARRKYINIWISFYLRMHTNLYLNAFWDCVGNVMVLLNYTALIKLDDSSIFIHFNDMLSIMRIITNNTMGSKTIHKRFSLGHLLCLSSHCGSIYSMLWSSSWTCVKWKIKTDHFLCIRCFPCYVGILMRYMTYCILSNMTTYNKYAQDTSFSRKDAFTILPSYWVWYYIPCQVCIILKSNINITN